MLRGESLPDPAEARRAMEDAPLRERYSLGMETGRKFLEAGEVSEAVAFFLEAMELSEPDSAPYEAAWREALEAASRGSEGELESLRGRVLESFSTSAAGMIRLAALEKAALRPDEELVWLRRAAEKGGLPLETRFRLAELESTWGDREAAARLFEELAKVLPDEVAPRLALASLEIRTGRVNQAERDLRDWLRAHPEAGNRTMVIRFLEENERLDAAAEILRESAQDPAGFAELEEFLLRHGKTDEVASLLEGELGKQENDAEKAHLARKLAELYHSQGKWDAAIYWASRAREWLPADGRAVIFQADLLAERGRLQEASQLLDAAASQKDVGLEAGKDLDRRLYHILYEQQSRMGASVDEKGRIDLLGIILPQISGTNPTGLVAQKIQELRSRCEKNATPWDYIRLARWLMFSGNARGAMEVLEEGAKTFPDDLDILRTAADTAVEQRDYARAIPLLELLAEKEPSERYQHLRRVAQMEADRGRLEEALALFQKLAEEQPTSVQAALDLVVAKQALGRWEESLTGLLDFWNRVPGPETFELRHVIVAAYEQLGQLEKAAEFLREATDQSLDEARQSMLLAELQTLRERGGLDGEETPAASEKIFPTSVEVLRALAIGAEDRGEWKKATDYLRKITVQQPMNVQAWVEYALACERMNRKEKARETWEKLVERFPERSDVVWQAAAYWLRMGDARRAARLLEGRQQNVGGEDESMALELGTALKDAGEDTVAAKLLLGLFKQAAPVPSQNSFYYPDTALDLASQRQAMSYATLVRRGFMQARSMGTGRSATAAITAPRGADARRQDAARVLGTVLKGDEARRFVEKLPPVEQCAFWFGAGEMKKSLEAARTWLKEDPQRADALLAVFRLALLAGDAPLIRSLLEEENGDIYRADLFMLALSQVLASGRADADRLAATIGESLHFHLVWQAARLFAAWRKFDVASELGLRVCGEDPAWLPLEGRYELAAWLVLAGKAGVAEDVLAGVVPAETGEGLNERLIDLVHVRLSMLKPEEQDAWLHALRESKQENVEIRHALMAVALDRLGRKREAMEEMRRYVAVKFQGASSGEYGENFPDSLRMSFHSLMTRGCHDLAADMIESALQQDAALLALYGETWGGWREELVRMRLAAALASADTALDVNFLHQAVNGIQDAALLEYLAAALQQYGRPNAAVFCWRRLLEMDPAHRGALEALWTRVLEKGDWGEAEEIGRKLVQEGRLLPGTTTPEGSTLRMLDVVEAAHGPRVALALKNVWERPSPALFSRKLSLLARQGDVETLEKASEESWIGECDVESRREAAQTLWRLNGSEKALQFLTPREGEHRSLRGELLVSKAALLSEMGRDSEAAAALGEAGAVGAIAWPVLGDVKDRPAMVEKMRELIRARLGSNPAPEEGFAALEALSKLPPQDGDTLPFLLRRGLGFALSEEKLKPRFALLCRSLADQYGAKTVRNSLEELFHVRGTSDEFPVLALELAIEAKESPDLIRQLARKAALVSDAPAEELAVLAERLYREGQTDSCLEIYRELARQDPASPLKARWLATAEQRAGNTEDAARAIAPHRIMAVWDDSSALESAQYFLDLRDEVSALETLQHTVESLQPPMREKAYEMVGQTLMRVGKREDVLAFARRLVEMENRAGMELAISYAENAETPPKGSLLGFKGTEENEYQRRLARRFVERGDLAHLLAWAEDNPSIWADQKLLAALRARKWTPEEARLLSEKLRLLPKDNITRETVFAERELEARAADQ